MTYLFSGSFLSLKGQPSKLRPTLSIDTKRPRVVIQRLSNGDPDERWIYTPTRTSIERPDGTIVEYSDGVRESFSGHELATPWSKLQFAYFTGYALWNYFVTPFVFTWPGFSTRELDRHVESGQEWRVLEVTYPPEVPAHSRVQRFYYDKQLMLQRLDYIVDVAGATATAAHYCYDHKEVGGIWIPTLRRVTSRLSQGPQLHGPSVFVLNFLDIKVRKHDTKEVSQL